MSTNARSVATRQEILDAAWSLIAQRGAEVSMSEIAGVAGISRQAVYLHFGTRGGLLMALVKRADERLRIREAFQEAMGCPVPGERIDAWLAAWFGFVPEILPVARDLVRLRPTDPDAAAAWEDRMADLRKWMRELVASLAVDGALRDGWSIDDATDYLWTASSVQVWDLLAVERGWGSGPTAGLLRRTIPLALLR